MKAVVVVPSVRESLLVGFLDAWREELSTATIVVVEDVPEPTFEIRAANVEHYAWCDIERELGEDAWIIPRRTGCIRSFGCWRAFQMGADMIVTLDDDTRPDPAYGQFLATHWHRLQAAVDPAWVSTLDAARPRGMPYFATSREGNAVLNHGLWSGVPDLDACTQLVSSRIPVPGEWSNRTIPRGNYFPLCAMNVAWRAEFTPALYFLLMGPEYPFDRFGDIWAGVLAKRIADHLGLAVNSGSPGVIHDRASNVFDNLVKESRGLRANETFWRAVDSVVLTARTVREAYVELADGLPLDGPEFAMLRRAMRTWADLFEDEVRSDPGVATPAFARGAPA